MLRYLVPDFIFADYYLSGADGLELLSRIKKDPRLRDAKVFLYSNHVNDEIVKPARAMGATGCIGQPDAIERLATIFKASLAIGPVAPMLF
jgi:CheY-like chemotaxis protein